jgi:hypothetical protein
VRLQRRPLEDETKRIILRICTILNTRLVYPEGIDAARQVESGECLITNLEKAVEVARQTLDNSFIASMIHALGTGSDTIDFGAQGAGGAGATLRRLEVLIPLVVVQCLYRLRLVSKEFSVMRFVAEQIQAFGGALGLWNVLAQLSMSSTREKLVGASGGVCEDAFVQVVHEDFLSMHDYITYSWDNLDYKGHTTESIAVPILLHVPWSKLERDGFYSRDPQQQTALRETMRPKRLSEVTLNHYERDNKAFSLATFGRISTIIKAVLPFMHADGDAKLNRIRFPVTRNLGPMEFPNPPLPKAEGDEIGVFGSRLKTFAPIRANIASRAGNAKVLSVGQDIHAYMLARERPEDMERLQQFGPPVGSIFPLATAGDAGPAFMVRTGPHQGTVFARGAAGPLPTVGHDFLKITGVTESKSEPTDEARGQRSSSSSSRSTSSTTDEDVGVLVVTGVGSTGAAGLGGGIIGSVDAGCPAKIPCPSDYVSGTTADPAASDSLPIPPPRWSEAQKEFATALGETAAERAVLIGNAVYGDAQRRGLSEDQASSAASLAARTAASAVLRPHACQNHVNGAFHIFAQGSCQCTSFAWDLFENVTVPIYRTTAGKQKWFREASNPDDCEAESRLKRMADYVVAAHHACKIWDIEESQLTAEILNEYMVLCARGCVLAAGSLVHNRFLETLEELKEGYRSHVPAIALRSRRMLLRLWAATGSTHYCMVEREMMSPFETLLQDTYSFAQRVDDLASIPIDLLDEKVNLDVRRLGGYQMTPSVFKTLVEVLPHLPELHRARVAEGTDARAKRLEKRHGRAEQATSGAPMNTQLAKDTKFQIFFNVACDSGMWDLGRTTVTVFPFGYESRDKATRARITKEVPRDDPVSLNGRILSPQGLWLERSLDERLSLVLNSQLVPHNYPGGTTGGAGDESRAVLESKRVVELKGLCKILGVKLSGTKTEFVDRLLAESLQTRLRDLLQKQAMDTASEYSDTPADIERRIRAVVLPRNALKKMLMTASAKQQAAERKWLKKWTCNVLLLQLGDAFGKLVSEGAATKELQKYVRSGKSTYCKALQLSFPLLDDDLWRELAACRVEEQKKIKVPPPPRFIPGDKSGWTERTMSLETVLDPALQHADYCRELGERRLSEARARISARGGAQVQTFRDRSNPAMPAQFSFITFTDRAEESTGPTGSDEEFSTGTNEEVDDCSYGDQHPDDRFQPCCEKPPATADDGSGLSDESDNSDTEHVYADSEVDDFEKALVPQQPEQPARATSQSNQPVSQSHDA